MGTDNLVSLGDLVAAGILTSDQAASLEPVAARFPLSVPPHVAELILQAGSVALFKQYVPRLEELRLGEEERPDPLGEAGHEAVKGLIHRYPDRVLLKLVNSCAGICRYCFRRGILSGNPGHPAEGELEEVLRYIREHREIWEVIFSGGDPLMLDVGRLRWLVAEVSACDHVRVLRVHTRLPVVAPERLTSAVTTALTGRLPVMLVLHCNHPDELAPPFPAVCRRLRAAGFSLFSQSVLLKDINDDAVILAGLFRCLLENGVKPYYLHHCDLAPGTGHFRTSLKAGRKIVADLRGRVSGLCLPEYVLDIPGGYGKVPAGAAWVREESAGGYTVRDFCGRRHPYPVD